MTCIVANKGRDRRTQTLAVPHGKMPLGKGRGKRTTPVQLDTYETTSWIYLDPKPFVTQDPWALAQPSDHAMGNRQYALGDR